MILRDLVDKELAPALYAAVLPWGLCFVKKKMQIMYLFWYPTFHLAVIKCKLA